MHPLGGGVGLSALGCLLKIQLVLTRCLGRFLALWVLASLAL